MSSSHQTAVVAVLLAAMACNDDASPSTDPIGGAGGSSAGSSGASGTAGSSGNAGTAAGTGGSAGTSDSGGTGGVADGPDASVPRIQAVIDGQFVRLGSEDSIWVSTCSGSMQLLQQVDGAWIPLQDDRPEASNLQFASHYLDGTYEAGCRTTLGCDASACEPIAAASDDPYDQRASLIPRELVQVGEGAAPTCERGDAGVPFDAGVDVDAGIQRVPALESRAPRGPLAVRVRYYTSANCQSPQATVDVPVD